MNIQVKALAAPSSAKPSCTTESSYFSCTTWSILPTAKSSHTQMLARETRSHSRVSTSTGNEYSRELAVGSPADAPFVFEIPKKIFAEKLVPGATAKLSYSVQTSSGNTAQSAELLVYLELQ
ncbi:hypothetical protein [Pseudomonas neuropathica]|uniref:hypothetical protein n=1 Tax=Pseudomonas neuropathica TaxID=2730425 RepID=UPI003EBC2F40